jgi:hypothetical protein
LALWSIQAGDGSQIAARLTFAGLLNSFAADEQQAKESQAGGCHHGR